MSYGPGEVRDVHIRRGRWGEGTRGRSTICDVQKEEEKYGDGRQALFRKEWAPPLGDVVVIHRGTHARVHRKAARDAGNAFEHRCGAFFAPAPQAVLDQRRRNHDQRGDGKHNGWERHVEEKGAVDLRAERALDGKERRDRPADDFARPGHDLVEDLRSFCFEDSQDAKHLDVRHAELLDRGACGTGGEGGGQRV